MWAELAPFVQPSLAVLLALVVVLLLTGRIVPVSTLTREVAAEQRRCDDIAAARDAERARADKLTEYIHQLLPYAHVTGELIGEMRRALPGDGTRPPVAADDGNAS